MSPFYTLVRLAKNFPTSGKSAALGLVCLCLLLGFSSSQAEVVKIPLGQQGDGSQDNGSKSIDRPIRGMNKAQVQSIFGQPDSTNGPSGSPPIYYWEYPEYTVYFEGDYVIHSVLKIIPSSSS